jgi:guanylate kinase
MYNHYPIVIISGPSGAGEDSIIEKLGERLPIERVVTTTTRSMRLGESEGHPYHFITKEDFLQKIEDKGFFEYAEEYNGHLYGVTFDELKRVEASHKVGVWKIEYKGVTKAKELIPNVVAIFVNAPLEVLESRIKRRDGASDEYIAERMKYTQEWLKYRDIYDYDIENVEGKLDESVNKTESIIRNLFPLDKKGYIV